MVHDVLKHEILKSYFTSDVINAPYQRLKNLGWISSYTKDLNSYVGFTVEGSLNTIVTFAEPLASGIYNVEFSVDGQIMTERMIVAKQ